MNVISRFINRYIGNALYMYPRVDWNENHFHSEFRILKKREKEIRGNSWTLLLLLFDLFRKLRENFIRRQIEIPWREREESHESYFTSE